MIHMVSGIGAWRIYGCRGPDDPATGEGMRCPGFNSQLAIAAAESQCEEPVKRKIMVKDKPEEREVPCGEKKDLFKLRYNNGQPERTLCPEHFKKRWIEPGADEAVKI